MLAIGYAVQVQLRAGEIIDDKVELLRPLGVGGMGSVWVARHLGLATEVAVKVIALNKAGVVTQTRLARFRREAKLAAKISCPHVVQIFDYGVFRDVPYIVMELLEGQSLADRLESQGRLPLRQVGALVVQLAKALTAAHAQGVIHRDLKPANVFLLDSGYKLFAKLLDFGVAKQADGQDPRLTATGALVGTPHYMSPEQLTTTKAVDHRADLWALAVVAYHALTGSVPFSGRNIGSLSIAVVDGRFLPVSTRLGGDNAVRCKPTISSFGTRWDHRWMV